MLCCELVATLYVAFRYRLVVNAIASEFCLVSCFDCGDHSSSCSVILVTFDVSCMASNKAFGVFIYSIVY